MCCAPTSQLRNGVKITAQMLTIPFCLFRITYISVKSDIYKCIKIFMDFFTKKEKRTQSII